MPTITIQDTSMQRTQPVWLLNIQEEVSSLREIIRSRVYQEVSEYNARQRKHLIGLIQSDPQISEPGKLDWEEQYKQALEGFSHKRYIVLVGQCQIIELDEPILLTETTNVHFFQLFSLNSPKCCLSL